VHLGHSCGDLELDAIVQELELGPKVALDPERHLLSSHSLGLELASQLVDHAMVHRSGTLLRRIARLLPNPGLDLLELLLVLGLCGFDALELCRNVLLESLQAWTHGVREPVRDLLALLSTRTQQ